jgi:hypothetical protein
MFRPCRGWVQNDELLTHGSRHGLQIFRRSAASACMQLDKDNLAS